MQEYLDLAAPKIITGNRGLGYHCIQEANNSAHSKSRQRTFCLCTSNTSCYRADTSLQVYTPCFQIMLEALGNTGQKQSSSVKGKVEPLSSFISF